jgi:hypothetical protein
MHKKECRDCDTLFSGLLLRCIDHQIDKILGEPRRIIDRKAFDQQGLMVENIGITTDLVRILLMNVFERLKDGVFRVDLENLVCLGTVLIRHLLTFAAQSSKNETEALTKPTSRFDFIE